MNALLEKAGIETMQQEVREKIKALFKTNIEVRAALHEQGALSRDAFVSLMLMPAIIPLEDCVSSNIKSFGYDKYSGTFAVVFSNGQEYRYLGVPEMYVETVRAAPSKGRAVNFIKTAYACVKIHETFKKADLI